MTRVVASTTGWGEGAALRRNNPSAVKEAGGVYENASRRPGVQQALRMRGLCNTDGKI